jgi:hypothetical protein
MLCFQGAGSRPMLAHRRTAFNAFRGPFWQNEAKPENQAGKRRKFSAAMPGRRGATSVPASRLPARSFGRTKPSRKMLQFQ